MDDIRPAFYKTTDTSLAAYLFAEGFTISGIDYTDDRALILFQNDNPKIKDYERLFYTGKSAVDAATYSRIHKRLSYILRNQIPWAEGVLHG